MKITTRVVLGFVLVLLLFVFVTVMNVRLSTEVAENLGWLTRAQQTLQTSAMSQRSLFEVQSTFRGYLLTADSTYLNTHKKSRQQLYSQLDTLQRFTSGAPAQQGLLNKIDSSVAQYYTVIDQLIVIRSNAAEGLRTGMRAYDTVIREHYITRTNQKLINSIITNFSSFDSLLWHQRSLRTTQLKASVNRSKNTSVGLAVVAVFISLLVIFLLNRSIGRRIAQMVGLAENVASGKVKQRIRDRNNDELSQVSASLQQMSDRIEAGIEELRKSNKELDQFAYVVSHDLKAPLRAIANLSQWIEEDLGSQDIPEDTVKHLSLMRGRVHRMENLINGILEYSRIGRISTNAEEFNVGELVKEVVEILAPPPHFTINIQPGMPTLYAEKLRMEQVFSNLIGNAIKYYEGTEGKVNIEWAGTGSFYEFSISDNGPGISPDYHDKIFTIFQTLEARDKVESTGVGLAIVKKIVEEQGGSIKVHSAKGQGSTFIFTWPKDSEVTNQPSITANNPID